MGDMLTWENENVGHFYIFIIRGIFIFQLSSIFF